MPDTSEQPLFERGDDGKMHFTDAFAHRVRDLAPEVTLRTATTNPASVDRLRDLALRAAGVLIGEGDNSRTSVLELFHQVDRTIVDAGGQPLGEAVFVTANIAVTPIYDALHNIEQGKGQPV